LRSRDWAMPRSRSRPTTCDQLVRRAGPPAADVSVPGRPHHERP
jgi:hypothetical protein